MNDIYPEFSFLAFIALLFVGLGLIAFAIYGKIKDNKFRKKGIVVNAKVKEISPSEENSSVPNYATTFEFEYEGTTLEKHLTISKNFKVGSQKEAIYFPSKDTLSVEGEGFSMSTGAMLALFVLAIPCLVTAAWILLDFSFKIVLASIWVCFGLSIFLILRTKVKQKQKSIIKESYHANITPNKYSSTDATLVRYIPKQNAPTKSYVLFSILLILFGSITTFTGIANTVRALNIKFSYPSTIAEITNVYSYQPQDSVDGLEQVGLEYHYVVDGKDYILDQKTKQSPDISFYEIGQKEKIYYAKNNPEQAILQSQLVIMVIPYVFGILFVYFGLRIYIVDKKQKRLYEIYRSTEEK